MLVLNEDLFDEISGTMSSIPEVETEIIADSEIEPDGPAQGEATGIANLIHDLIIDENEAIQGYNNAAANMENYPELQKIMHDIAGEEFAHIGELQKALELISPNAEKIAEGEAETEEAVDSGSPIDESLLQELHKDHEAIRTTYGQEIYDLLTQYMLQDPGTLTYEDNPYDLGNILYKSNYWELFKNYCKEHGHEII